jgi:hypothetical protein
MVITTCRPPARRGGGDRQQPVLNINQNKPPFKWEVLYKEDKYSPVLFSLLKSIKKLFGAVTKI